MLVIHPFWDPIWELKSEFPGRNTAFEVENVDSYQPHTINTMLWPRLRFISVRTETKQYLIPKKNHAQILGMAASGTHVYSN